MKSKQLILGIGFVLIALVAIAGLTSRQTGDVKTFSSTRELASFLESNAREGQGNNLRTTMEAGGQGAPTPATVDSSKGASTSTSNRYSTTNVQVAGVDEPDFVKNDGQYIYLVQNGNFTIVKAAPAASMEILSTTKLGEFVNALFIQNDIALIMGQEATYTHGCPDCPLPVASEKIAATYPAYYGFQKSFIRVYDISDRENPILINNVTYDGNYYDARLIGNEAYIIANQPLVRNGEDVALPAIYEKSETSAIKASDISYFPIRDSGYQLTTIFTLNLDNPESDVHHNSFLTGYTQTMYVSEKALYLTSPAEISYEDHQTQFRKEVLIPALSGDARAKAENNEASDVSEYDKERALKEIIADYYNALSNDEKTDFENKLGEKAASFEKDWQQKMQRTTIIKITLDNGDSKYVAKGSVPGYLLNQFSLDEHDGYLRVATTSDGWFSGGYVLADVPGPTDIIDGQVAGADEQTEPRGVPQELIRVPDTQIQTNQVYILNNDLDIVGTLENIGVNERIQSARFMSDRLYLVTFKQIDPLFVIDLSSPSNPHILGELKIPGYSTYLHPFDEDTIIGIGQDTDGEIQEGTVTAAIPAGLKIALFDVADPNHPQEIDHYTIGDRGSSSDALYDHKAFMFDKETSTLVLPIVAQQRATKQADANGPWYSTLVSFQGAYVLHMDKESGIELKGTITHLNATEQADMKKAFDETGDVYYYPPYDAQITRSLFIDDTVYTISQRTIKANDFTTLDEQASLTLPHQEPVYYAYSQEGIATRDKAQ